MFSLSFHSLSYSIILFMCSVTYTNIIFFSYTHSTKQFIPTSHSLSIIYLPIFLSIHYFLFLSYNLSIFLSSYLFFSKIFFSVLRFLEDPGKWSQKENLSTKNGLLMLILSSKLTVNINLLSSLISLSFSYHLYYDLKI
jgi:hypothetical protein